MLKVVGVVLNSLFLVEGVEFEGVGSDFGELNYSDKRVRKFISRANLIASRFKNNEIDCSSGKVVRINNFKFSSCNLYSLKDGKIAKIENDKISLIRRIVNNNDTVGFEVKLLGEIKTFTTGNTIALSELFKPDGYRVLSRIEYIKKFDPSGKLVDFPMRKPYLVGDAGKPLSDLPIKDITTNVKDTKLKSNVTRTIQMVDINELEPDVSKYGLYELIELIKKYDGLIVTNKDTKYISKSTTVVDEKKSLFVPLDMVEVASPNITYSDKSINANLKFRRLGFVYLNGVPYPTFLWREKSIFYNGKPNLSKFSIAISKDGSERLFKEFGESLSVKVSDDKQYLKSIEAIFSRENLVLVDVDASKLSVVSLDSTKSNKFYMHNKDILLNTIRLNKCKMEYKILKEVLARNTEESDRVVFKAFSKCSYSELCALEELGVNIVDGSYNEPITSKNESSSSDRISVEYNVVGMKSLPSVNKMLQDTSECAKLIDGLGLQDSLNLVTDGLPGVSLDDIKDKYKALKDSVNLIRKDIYLHKVGLLNKNRFEFYDSSSNWNAYKARANSKLNNYTCAEDGLEKLCLTLDNIELH